MSGLRDELAALADGLMANGCNDKHQQGETDECNCCTAYTFAALLDRFPPEGEGEVASVPSDADLDSLVALLRDALRGSCGSHEGCHALAAKHQRDAARRWFIGRLAAPVPHHTDEGAG